MESVGAESIFCSAMVTIVTRNQRLRRLLTSMRHSSLAKQHGKFFFRRRVSFEEQF